MILMLANILDKHKENYDDEFPILLQEDGSLIFSFQIREEEWKKPMIYP